MSQISEVYTEIKELWEDFDVNHIKLGKIIINFVNVF